MARAPGAAGTCCAPARMSVRRVNAVSRGGAAGSACAQGAGERPGDQREDAETDGECHEPSPPVRQLPQRAPVWLKLICLKAIRLRPVLRAVIRLTPVGPTLIRFAVIRLVPVRPTLIRFAVIRLPPIRHPATPDPDDYAACAAS